MSGGYTEHFTQPIYPHLVCAVCKNVCRIPEWACKEHHICCQACLTKQLEADAECPLCKNPKQDYDENIRTRDKAIERVIDNLEVECRFRVNADLPPQCLTSSIALNNKGDSITVTAGTYGLQTDDVPGGCNWKGPLYKLEEHLQTDCKFFLVTCGHRGCKVEHQRQATELHKEKCEWRAIVCPLTECGRIMPWKEVASHVANECSKREITCDLCKRTGIWAQDKEKHLAECPMVPVPCEFQKYGCWSTPPRYHLRDHLINSTAHHLNLVMNHLCTTKEHTEALVVRADLQRQLIFELEEKLKAAEKTMGELAQTNSVQVTAELNIMKAQIQELAKANVIKMDALEKMYKDELDNYKIMQKQNSDTKLAFEKQSKRSLTHFLFYFSIGFDIVKKFEGAGREWFVKLHKDSKDESKVIIQFGIDRGVSPLHIVVRAVLDKTGLSSIITTPLRTVINRSNEWVVSLNLTTYDTFITYLNGANSYDFQLELVVVDSLAGLGDVYYI